MNILFRADASSTIGTGHIMRDLVLAEQYPEGRIIFATQALEGNLNTKILESGHEVEDLGSNDVEKLIDLVEKLSVDMVIIDHYGIDHVFEKELRRRTGIQLMVLDDMYEKHCCDILLNHNIYAEVERYRGLVPERCELRCGEEFTLIREEFHDAKREIRPLSDMPKRIFLAMGGADAAHLNIAILEALKNHPNSHMHVLTTTANRHLAELKEYVERSDGITLHINSNRVAELMSRSHLAIVTPSVILNEVYFMGLPFIAIQTAENQSEMVAFLERNDLKVLRGFEKMSFQKALEEILHTSDIQLTNFTDLDQEEKIMVLAWRNHPEVRRWMFTKAEIDPKDHFTYIRSLEGRTDRLYFLVKKENGPIGVIDFTAIDRQKQEADIGLYADPSRRGVGNDLMNAILSYGSKQLDLKRFLSEVYEENVHAIALYQRFGFREIDRKGDIIVMERIV